MSLMLKALLAQPQVKALIDAVPLFTCAVKGHDFPPDSERTLDAKFGAPSLRVASCARCSLLVKL